MTAVASRPSKPAKGNSATRPLNARIGLLLLSAAGQALAVSSPALADHSRSGAPVSEAKSVGRALSEQNGEEACENKGLDSSECAAVGCCYYDDGVCWSNVYDGACSGGMRPCAASCPAGVCDSPADASKPECAACVACQQAYTGTDEGEDEGEDEGDGANPCGACCPAGVCVSEADVSKPECAACLACHTSTGTCETPPAAPTPPWPPPSPPTLPPSPPSLPEECPNTCYNRTCDDLLMQSQLYNCAILEQFLHCNCFGCLCGNYSLVPRSPPSPPSPPLPPLQPPASPAAIGDPKFGCGYRGPHLAEPTTPDALTAAVSNANVTCIKLAPITYSLTSTLLVGKDDSTSGTEMLEHPRGNAPLAILAEEGPATLDGGGSVQLISAGSGADVSLANLVLRNGYAADGTDGRVRLGHAACVMPFLWDANRLAAAGEHVHRALAPCAGWRHR